MPKKRAKRTTPTFDFEFFLWLEHLQNILPKNIVLDGLCWRWRNQKYPPRVKFKKKDYALSRIILAAVSELPENLGKKRLVCMHSCDNHWCVNPQHLSWGTQKENMQDCKRKGRHRTGAKIYK